MRVETSTALTLGDLLADGLGLQLLTGGPEARRRRVAGAHVIEVEHPSAWLERDWVVLTTGVRLRNNAEAQRALIAELDAVGAAALGFGVGVVFKRVPTALRDEARRRGLPVFAVPLETPFRDIISAVASSLLSSEVRSLRRVSSLQLYLIDALDDDAPRRTVVDRLARFAEASVTLFSPDGAVVEACGTAPTQEVWALLSRASDTLVQFDHGAWQTVATPVQPGGATSGWLAVTTERRSPRTRFIRAATRSAAPVLAALSRLDGLVDAQARAARAALFDELVAAEPAGAARLAAQAASLGVAVDRPARMAVLVPAGAPSGTWATDRDAVAAALEGALAEHTAGHLVGVRDAGVAAYAPLSADTLRDAVRAVVAERPGWVAGVGRETSGLGGLRDSLRDAEIAAHRAACERDGDVLMFDDFDLATLVVTETPSDRLQPKVDELMRRLDEHPTILEAVVAYFEHDLDIMRTAQAMHLHHNSLRYRLGRAEHFLGRSLKDPATIASIYVALTARAARVDRRLAAVPAAAAA